LSWVESVFPDGVTSQGLSGQALLPGPNPFSAAAATSADGSRLAVASFGIHRAQFTPSPRLKIAPARGSSLISWTVPSLAFDLQQSATLTPGSWTNVGTVRTLSLTNLQNQVAVPSVTGRAFYRLKY